MCILHLRCDFQIVPYIKHVGINSYIPALSSAFPFPSPGSMATKLEQSKVLFLNILIVFERG